MLNEHHEWWKAVSKRFVDTCRLVDSQRFRDVNSRGYINGGDWYVIRNGRQDYFNYYHNMREMTMELSSTKTLSTNRLNHYWQCQSHALINYIKEIHHLNDSVVTRIAQPQVQYKAYPNPTRGKVHVETPQGTRHIDLSDRPAGVYFIPLDGYTVKVVKQ